MHTDEFNEKFKQNAIELLSIGKSTHYLEFKQKIWDWQYKQNPFKTNLKKGISAFEGEKFIGFNGLMAIRVKYQGDIINAYWSVDTILDPICRGSGYGGKLVDIIKKNSPLVLGFGISDIQAHIMRRRGYDINNDIEEYFHTIKSVNLVGILKKIFQLFKIVKSLNYRPTTKSNLEVSIREASDAPKQIDSLWEKVKNGYSKIAIRDHSLVHWKYGSCPLAKYKLILIQRNGELAGVGVFRKNENTSKLIDYIGPSVDMEIKYLIVKTFKAVCSQSKRLSCICSDNELKKALEFAGFLKYRRRPRFYVYSNIENDQNPASNWFVMTGDSDTDFSEFEYF